MRRTVLVTGMSGTGKSAALTELSRRGHATVDTDDPGWIVMNADGERLWDTARVRDRLSAHDTGRLYVSGCVANQGEFYSEFDVVVLLSAPLEVILSRVQHRENPYGSTRQDRDAIIADHAEVEPLLRRRADRELDATQSPEAIVDALESI